MNCPARSASRHSPQPRPDREAREGTKTLAAACVMSTGSVSEAKKELVEAIVPFIRIEKKTHGSGFDYDEITITDIWKLNHDVYDPDFTVHNVNRSQYEQTVHNVKLRISLIENNPIGGKPPKTVLSVENAILTGQPVTEETLKEQKHKQMMDAANIIGMSFGVNAGLARNIALAFMEARGIVIAQSKLKGQRKAIQEMIESGVAPDHVRQATADLLGKQMTVADLYSVSKTAIDLANPKPEDKPVQQPKPKFFRAADQPPGR